MNDALYIAATGMSAQSAQLDTIANNIANVNTPAFKRGSLRFADLFAGIPLQRVDEGAPSGLAAGVRVGDVQRSFADGEVRKVDDAMSLAIQGDGFLEVRLPDGSTAFARNGRLAVNADGLLTLGGTHPLRGNIHVPSDVRTLVVAEDGQVSGRDDLGRTLPLGQVELALFATPSGLSPAGDGLWRVSSRSGDAILAPPGEAGTGRLKQGHQEASNVKLVDEMVQLMVAQRAYEMSVKVLQAADEVSGMTNDLRK